MEKLRNYSLSLVLAALFLVSWMAQGAAQATAEGFSWAKFFEGTFENWQSEFLQLLTFVVLTSFLIHKGSHESKDGQERLERKIDAVLERHGVDPWEVE